MTFKPSRKDLEHEAAINILVETIEPMLVGQDVTVRSAVLAVLLARLLTDYPTPHMRNAILDQHFVLIDGIVEHFDRQAAGQRAN